MSTFACARCDATGKAKPGQPLPAGWEEHTSTRHNATYPVCDSYAGEGGSRATSGNVAADQLRLFIERIERLEEEKKGIGDDIKDVYSELKAVGFDPKCVRKVVGLRKQDPLMRREESAILETYLHALGMEDG